MPECLETNSARAMSDPPLPLCLLTAACSNICLTATGLQTEEARELWPTFSRDLPQQQVPFCRAPTSVSHGKTPPPKKNRKKSRGRKIDLLPLEKSLFFRWKNADFSARVARFFRKFWRSSGAKGRDLSLGFKASEKSEGTLPVQCDHDRAIARAHATSFSRDRLEMPDFRN